MNEATSRGVVGEALRLLRPFWRLALFSTLAGIASGLATAFLLGAINRALQTEGGATSAVLLSFGGLCLFTIVSAIVAHIGNSTVSQDIVASVQLELCAKIVRAPIREIERMQASLDERSKGLGKKRAALNKASLRTTDKEVK